MAFGIPGFLESSNAPLNKILLGQNPIDITATVTGPVKTKPDNSGGDISTAMDNQYTGFFDKQQSDRTDIAGIIEDFKNSPNAFNSAVLNGTLLDNPVFQRIQRNNQAVAAKSLKDLQSKLGANAGARGLRGGGRDALEMRAAEDALATRLNADSALAGQFTDIFTRAGAAQDSILGSLTNARINNISNEDYPLRDLFGEAFDQQTLEKLPDALAQLQNSIDQTQNQFLADPNIKSIVDFAQLFLPFLNFGSLLPGRDM